MLDGKKIKNAAKRLAPTRGYRGRLLGAKALVAMDARRGLALAMSDSLDGEANEVPLVPAVLGQVRAVVDRPVLWLCDRQFGDAATLRRLGGRPGDRFVVRLRKGLVFRAESTRVDADEQGRTVLDQIGLLGRDPRDPAAMRVRLVTLHRGGEDGDDVRLVSDLMDPGAFGSLSMLALYRHRWGVEQMFQQVTQTFALEHLIGCRPRAILFQFALCLLLYNLIQVVKAFVADDGRVAVAIVSTYGLFYDVKRELIAWAYLGPRHPGPRNPGGRVRRTAGQMRKRLRELLRGTWDPVAHTKAADKKPRNRPQNRPLPGGHTSVQRLLLRAATGISP